MAKTGYSAFKKLNRAWSGCRVASAVVQRDVSFESFDGGLIVRISINVSAFFFFFLASLSR